MNFTKRSKHFTSLVKGDSFMLNNRHLVFQRYTRGKRIICMTHSPDMIYKVSLVQQCFQDSPIIDVWTAFDEGDKSVARLWANQGYAGI